MSRGGTWAPGFPGWRQGRFLDSYGNPVAVGYGSAVASAGDVDGDGLDDVVIGAPRYAVNRDHLGAAFVYLGHAP